MEYPPRIPPCKACTNPSYHKCIVAGKEVCIAPVLVCDSYMQCDDWSDEENCANEYKTRKIISEDAYFPCKHTYLPSNQSAINLLVKFWGVRCDGESTCIEGEDELGCLDIPKLISRDMVGKSGFKN